MSKYEKQRLSCLIRGKFHCSLKEAWEIMSKYNDAEKEAKNAKSNKKENSKQLKIDL